MALENQELQQIAEELRNSFQGLNAATKDANVGLDAFKKKVPGVVGDLAKGMGGFTKEIAKGNTSLSSMNTVVDVAANAVSGLAKTVPIFGEALSAATKAVAEGAKLVVNQLDQTAKTFNAMSATGALVADGMTGLSRQFTTAGLNLQQFQKVVGQNSVALARFRGMAGEGAEEFSQIVGNLTQKQDTDLRKIGMSAEDIASTSAAFVTQQTRLGKAQSMSTDQLTAGSKQYAMELDALQKVTGLSREAIQKQQDAALSESKFRANYELAMRSGDEDRIRGAKAMMTLQTRMTSFDAEMGQGVRDLSSGVANTEASIKLLGSTGGAASDIMARLKSGMIDQDQAQNELVGAMERHSKSQLDIAGQVGDAPGVYLKAAGVMDAINAKNEGAYEKAKKTQDAQINKTDDLTKSTVLAQQNLEKMNIEFSKMAIKLMPQAAYATKKMTDTMLDMIKWVNKEMGRQDVDTEQQDEANWKQMTTGEKFQSSLARGLEKAVGVVSTTGKNFLQGQRVENESAYLEKQGRPGVVPPTRGAVSGSATAPAVPPKRGAVGSGATAPVVPTTQDDLASMGLKIKKGDVQAKDSGVSTTLLDLAQQIQESVPGFAYFSGFNDQYHQDKKGGSNHVKGLALDFALGKTPSKEEGASIVRMLKEMGASYAQDEYANLSPGGTGGHIHAEVSAANGAILSGPAGGYRPNLTMHGTEAIVPLDSPAAQSMGIGSGENTSLMTAQLEKLDEMVSVMKNQLDVSRRIMQYAS
jgi:hypothetical protein